MTVSAPPRPPSPVRDVPSARPLQREEIEALVEALIEEARLETRRRRRRYWTIAALATFLAAVGLTVLQGGAASSTGPVAAPAASSVAAGVASSHIAFLRNPAGAFYDGDLELWVM